LTLVTVLSEENECPLSNDVSGDFCGDRGCPGRRFCSLPMLKSGFELVGDREVALLSACALLYLSCVVCTFSTGGPPAAAALWSNLLAMFFTLPACRDGSNTGFDRTLFRTWLPTGLDTERSPFRTGERENERPAAAEPTSPVPFVSVDGAGASAVMLGTVGAGVWL
jgi:hypothetical protein